MKRLIFLASLLLGLALAFAPVDAPRVIAQTFSGQPSPGYLQIGQGVGLPKWQPVSGSCTLTSPGNLTCSSNQQVDIFLVIGDSQAVGQGNSAQSPLVPTSQGLAYCANGTIPTANDPVCSAVNAAQNANTGSMWPAFTIAYGRRIGFVVTGVSGSTQASAADFHAGGGNWQDTTAGSNYANSLAALNSALTAFANAGYSPVFRGIIYVLANNDAAQIDNAVITSPTYITGYTLMAANYRAATIGGATYPHLPIYIAQVGTSTNQSDYGYGQIRSAQLAITTSDPNSLLANTDLASFNVRGLVNSGPHLTQAGYNQLGTEFGAAIIPFVQGSIPFRVFSANAEAPQLPSTGTVVQIVGKDSTLSQVSLDAFGSFGNYLVRSSGGPATSPSGITNGSVIGDFSVQSFGATTYGNQVQGALLFSATQNHTDAAKGTQACIYTTANGSVAATCNFVVDQAGDAQINSGTTFNWNADTFLSRAAAATIHLGQADAASPVAQKLGVQGVVAGTSNTAGANWTIAGSQGTGTGAGGGINFQVAPAGGSGSSQNALADVMQIASTQRVNIGTTATAAPDAPLTINANTVASPTAAFAGTNLHLVGANGANNILIFDAFNNSGSNVNSFFARYANGTASAPTAAAASSATFTILAQNYDGVSTYRNSAIITFSTINQTSPTDSSGSIAFGTAPTGSTTTAQRILLKSGVIIGTGTTDPGANTLAVTGQTFASLTGSPVAGTIAYVTDALAANCGDTTCTTWGTTVTGGTGALKRMVWYNGTNWTLIGK